MEGSSFEWVRRGLQMRSVALSCAWSCARANGARVDVLEGGLETVSGCAMLRAPQHVSLAYVAHGALHSHSRAPC